MSALGRGSQNRQGYGSRDRPRAARLEEQLARARCREFRDDHAAAGGILAGQGFTSKLTGDGSLQKRPMKRVISPLREMGADIRARDDNLRRWKIRGAQLKAIDYKMPMASAQVKSAVLLAGLFADGVDGRHGAVANPGSHRAGPGGIWGGYRERPGGRFEFTTRRRKWQRQAARAKSLDVPGDCLRRYFLSAAASLFPDSNLLIHNVGLNPTRTAILDIFASMGCCNSNPWAQERPMEKSSATWRRREHH